MTKLRTALLVAAAALAGMPAMASAQAPGPDRDGGRPDRGAGGNHDHGGAGRPDRGAHAPGTPPPPAPAQPQAPPAAPQQVPTQQEPQRHGGDRHDSGRPDDSRRNFGLGDGRADPRLGSNAPGGPSGYAGRPDDRGRPAWDRGQPGWDHRQPESDHGRPGWDRGGPGWDHDRGPGGWRNDRRYDWRGWRDRNRGLFHGPRYAPPRGYGYGYRAFSPGFRLDPFFYDRSYWIDDPYAYRLPPAYGPYRWVRYYDDVLLVDLGSGIVVDVIRNFFW